MPIYVHHCWDCERDEEVYYKMSENPTISCGDCGAPMPRRYMPHAIIGPTDTKPFVSEQLGRTFTSQKQLDAFLRESGKEMTSASDKRWKDQADRAYEKADAQSKRLGYKDFEDRKQKRRAEKIAQGKIQP